MKYILILFLVTIHLFADINLYQSNACNINRLTHHDIKNIFLKKIDQMTPLHNQESYKGFLKEYLHKTPTKMNIYWTRMVFTGSKNPPRILTNQEIAHFKVEDKVCYITYSHTKLNTKIWKRITVVP